MGSATVSIIIPVLNAAHWLQDTLDSALAQTWPDTEIIVVDDGSTDNSLEIAHSNESERLTVLSQQNRGAAAARNAGLRVAQGDFIQFLDADDLLDPRKIEVQVGRLLLEGGRDCVASGSWAMFNGSIDDVAVSPEPLWKDMGPAEWLCALFRREGMMPIHAWLFPRKVLDSAGSWDERLTLNDDREYSCRAVLNAVKVIFCPESVSYYRRGVLSSLSSTRSEAAWTSAFLASEQCVQMLLDIDKSEKTRSACAMEYFGLILSMYPAYPDLRKTIEKRIAALQLRRFVPSFADPVSRGMALVLGWKAVLMIRYVLHRARS